MEAVKTTQYKLFHFVDKELAPVDYVIFFAGTKRQKRS
jgi:hypothetical protein